MSYRGQSFRGMVGLLLSAGLVTGQNIAVRANVPPDLGATVRVEGLPRAPELLIIAAQDDLRPNEYAEVRKFANSVFRATHDVVDIRFGLLSNGALVDLKGPFGSIAELQSALKGISTGTPSAAPNLLPGLITSLGAIPSSWGFTVVLGHAPELDRYSSAWLLRNLIEQKRSLTWWDPAGAPNETSLRATTAASGGAVIDDADQLARMITDPGQLFGISWSFTGPSKGFELRDQQLPQLGTFPILFSRMPHVPSIEEYRELRQKTSRAAEILKTGASNLSEAQSCLERALAINPVDDQALTLGIDLWERLRQPEREIPLLQLATEMSPGDAVLWAKLGNIEYDEADLPAAEAALLKARELGAASPLISEHLGRILIERKNLPKALDYFDDSLRQDDRQQELWYLTADISKELGRSDKQAASLERALLFGDDVGRHIELINLYFSRNDITNAARHTDLELPRIPQDPDSQTLWAGFYERLARMDDALVCWKRVVAADSKREEAHNAIAAIYLSKMRWTDALDASEAAFGAGAGSARLQLIRTTALEKLNRIYEARRSITDYAAQSTDVALLQRFAEMTDIYGGDGPSAYRRYVEQLLKTSSPKDDLRNAARRGRIVSIREGDSKSAAWFGQIESPETARRGGEPPPETGVWIPGGLDALAFVAQGNPGTTANRFLPEYCRTLLAHQERRDSKEAVLYRKSIALYFAHLRDLIALAPPKDNRSVLTVSIRDRKAQSQTETVLNILGWKMRRVNNKVVIQSGEKAAEADKQEIASALAIDQAGMQAAFQEAKPFRIEIPFEWVPVRLGEETWRSTLQPEKYAGGMAEALSDNPSFARAYLALSNVDTSTAEILAFRIGLPNVAAKYSDLLALYSAALATSNEHAVVPGGPAAEPLWASMAGRSPANAAEFFRALFDKNEGKLLAWFSAIAGLDLAHQGFFTASANRLNSFYQAFLQSPDMQVGAGRLAAGGSFGQFLREVPLEEGHVSFPGAPEVWMIAKGRSSTSTHSDKLLRKVRKIATPEIEDEILLRLARTRFKSAGSPESELDNFLAVTRIDALRDEPLDDDSALILAQNYNEFRSFYPYFGVFRDLTSMDYRNFFSVLTKLKSFDIVDSDIALGQFEALLEILKLGHDFGDLTAEKASAEVRTLCSQYLSAADLAGYTVAALDAIRRVVKNDPDADLEAMVLGRLTATDLDWNGFIISLDPAKERSLAFRRVLELQKAPSLTALIRMDQAIRDIDSGKTEFGPSLDALQKAFTSLPVVEIPKSLKFIGASHQSILRENPAKIGQAIAELRQKTTRKKVNQSDLQKQGREILELMAPQTRVALDAVIYGAYLRPEDILTANDPLLLRKHEAFDLRVDLTRTTKFPDSVLAQASTGQGSLFIGGFGRFATAAARAAGSKPGPEEALYASQIAAIRMTPWPKYSEDDQLMVGLKVRAVREWCIEAAENPALLQDIGAETAGILSLNRRRQLLNSISEKRWDDIWSLTTLSDLLFLSERYVARYPEGPIKSPVDRALRQAGKRSSDNKFDLLGPVAATLFSSNEPQLSEMAPYEEYERHLFPTEIAERTAEMKIYLSYALDKYALPPTILPAVAEPVMKRTFSSMRMSDPRDWMAAIKAFEGIDDKVIGTALRDHK